jgi:hypothetical protein
MLKQQGKSHFFPIFSILLNPKKHKDRNNWLIWMEGME